MSQSIDTDELRRSAPEWNLDGDRKLLNLLQNIHQNITSRCTETSVRLQDMFTSLDHAKVSIDNVNNRFMSLSNTQFVESRVYEDDTEFVNLPPPTSEKQPQPVEIHKNTPQQNLAAALLSLEMNHERVTILDDSDSDTDDEGASVILRPKDVYQNRPLPYIIGSQSWKSKWHAGLIAEDSETESIESKKEEDLSESDESVPRSAPTNVYDAESFRSVSPASLPVQDDLYKPDMSRVYKPFAAANTVPQGYLFNNEPPPMDNNSDATSVATETDSDDIFAELHKKIQPTTQHNTNFVSKEIYNNDIVNKDIFNNESHSALPTNRRNTNLANKDLYHNDNDEKSQDINKKISRNDIYHSESDIVVCENENDTFNSDVYQYGNDTQKLGVGVKEKKPTGAVSLFETKNASDSIGAAILKRNQRKSSSSEDDDERTNKQANKTQFNQNNTNNIGNNNKEIKLNSGNNSIKNTNNNNPGLNVIEEIVNRQNNGNKQVVVTDKNIFDELFAKSKQNTTKPKEETKKVAKIDVFSDIFDDIDDIFTSDVKNDRKNSKKSIFDDDSTENDLFSDITVKTPVAKDIKKSNKSIFDDDEDLFNEPDKKLNQSKESTDKRKAIDKVAPKTNSYTSSSKVATETDESFEKNILFNSKEDNDIAITKAKESTTSKPIENNPLKKDKKLIKSIFDSDSDDGDIFSVIKAPEIKKPDKNTETNIAAQGKSNLFNDTKQTQSNILENKFEQPKITQENKSDSKETQLNKQENESNDLFKISKESPQRSDTESNKSGVIIDSKATEIIKTRPSENNEQLDQNYVKKSNKPKKPSQIDDDKIFNEPSKPESNYKPSVLQPKGYINTSNTLSTNVNDYTKEVPQNLSEYNFEESQFTAAENIEQDLSFDAKEIRYRSSEAKDEALNHNTLSDVQKDLNTQSHSNKSSDQTKSQIDIKTDDEQVLAKDTFEDIFPIEPPEFEKIKETKSNQNVNALFGDDSEDENLFFKKETPISDVKPDKIESKPIDQLFDVFRDEPPDFDDDFLFKARTDSPEKLINTKDTHNKEDLFSDSPKARNTESKTNVTVKEKGKENELCTAKLDDKKEPIFDSKPTKNQEEIDGNTIEQNKPIGKLKPINFNINVANLLPGASPKKNVKSPEPDVSSTDGSIFTKLTYPESVPISKNCTEARYTDPVLVKSVSFDSDPESTVLDNKISKQRARIQVKRRPSTRQARKDAARKSVIEFDETTDTVDSNFESNADVTRKTDEDQQLTSVTDINRDSSKSIKDTDIFKYSISQPDNLFVSFEGDKQKQTFDECKMDSSESLIESINTKTDLNSELNQKTLEEAKTTEDLPNNVLGNTVIIEKPLPIHLPKSIEDLQKNVLENPGNSITNYKDDHATFKDGTQVLNINEDDIYIFRETKAYKNELVETKISTLGQAYHITEAKDTKAETVEKKKSIFDEDDDELLFSVGNTKKEFLPNSNKSVFKSSLFNEDESVFSQTNPKAQNLKTEKTSFADDKDLFSNNDTINSSLPKSGTSKNEVVPKTNKSIKPSIFDEDDEELFSSGNTKPLKALIKKSLFDDLSDEDDNLFGGKSKTSTKSGLFSSNQHKTEPKSLKTTLFDDDTTDIFGSSSKREIETKSRPSRTEVNKDKKESTETFEDPLSMFQA